MSSLTAINKTPVLGLKQPFFIRHLKDFAVDMFLMFGCEYKIRIFNSLILTAKIELFVSPIKSINLKKFLEDFLKKTATYISKFYN